MSCASEVERGGCQPAEPSATVPPLRTRPAASARAAGGPSALGSRSRYRQAVHLGAQPPRSWPARGASRADGFGKIVRPMTWMRASAHYQRPRTRCRRPRCRQTRDRAPAPAGSPSQASSFRWLGPRFAARRAKARQLGADPGNGSRADPRAGRRTAPWCHSLRAARRRAGRPAACDAIDDCVDAFQQRLPASALASFQKSAAIRARRQCAARCRGFVRRPRHHDRRRADARHA